MNAFDRSDLDRLIYEPAPIRFLNRNQKNFDHDAMTVDTCNSTGVMVYEATKQGYAVAEEGDSINLSCTGSATRRGRVGKGVVNTLDTGMQQHTLTGARIRRLTPTECERLQGFPDGWTEGISDTQRYKCLGNAVSVPVVKAVFKAILEADLKAPANPADAVDRTVETESDTNANGKEDSAAGRQ